MSGECRTVYLVFQYREHGLASSYEFQGVFGTKTLAVAACRSKHYLVCPAVLNQPYPDETVPLWPGAWYPHLQPEPK